MFYFECVIKYIQKLKTLGKIGEYDVFSYLTDCL